MNCRTNLELVIRRGYYESLVPEMTMPAWVSVTGIIRNKKKCIS
jgi:hypothetical protein